MTFSTQAKAPYTVADLQERLVPTGLWSCYSDSDYHCHRTAIALSTVQYATNVIELLPLPLLEHGCEQTPMRVRRVTIVSAPSYSCLGCHCKSHCPLLEGSLVMSTVSSALLPCTCQIVNKLAAVTGEP